MPKNFVQQAFHTWIKKNRKRFRHPPTQICYVQGGVRFFFSDVTHEISAVINKFGCNVAFTYQNEVWDLLVCFDVTVERDNGGYYCSQCLAGENDTLEERFSSRMDLLVDHVFEPLLEWSNERLAKDVIALLHQTENGSTWVEILTSHN